MKTMNRRSFFNTTALAGLAATLGGGARAGAATKTVPVPDRPAELNLCLQWNGIPGGGMNEKLDFLEANGFTAVELPTGKWLFDNGGAFQKAIQGRKLAVATACGPSDFSYADKARREAEVEKFLPQLEILGGLKSVGLILCPARKNVAMGFRELRDDFVNNTGRRLARHAAKHGTSIVLEPLRRGETPFLKLVADGASIARDIGEGAAVMGDFWHMAQEETSQMGAFLSGGNLLKHVHIASLKDRKIPGCEPKYDRYVDGFRGLKMIGYRGAVSFEGGIPKGGDRVKLIKAMVIYLRDQWAEA